MDVARTYNGGVYIKPVTAMIGTAITAGTAGDNKPSDTIAIDRLGFMSCQLVLSALVNLSDGKALNATVAYQDSADGTNWNASTSIGTFTIATGALANTLATLPINLNLSGYDRFVKFTITPDLTASGTDTATVNAYMNLCGAENIPAS